MSIKVRLILFALIVSILPLTLASFLFFKQASHFIMEETFEKIEAMANEKQARLETVLQLNDERISGLTSRTQLRISLWRFLKELSEGDKVKVEDILQDARESILDFRDIFIADKNGTVIISTRQSLVGTSIQDEEYFSKSKKDNYIDIILNSQGSRILLLTGPLYLDSVYLGSVIVHADASSFFDVLKDYEDLGQSAEILLAQKEVGDKARFIVPRRFEKEKNNQDLYRLPANSAMSQALLGKQETFINMVDYRGASVLAASRYFKEQKWGLVVKVDKSEAFINLNNLKRIILYAGLAIMGIVLLLSMTIARSIYKPVQELYRATKLVGEKRFDFNFRNFGKNEFGRLAESFKEMAFNIKDEQEKKEKELQERIEAEKRLEVTKNELVDLNKRLEQMTITDPLTACLNRRGLQQILSREYVWVHRGYATSVLLVDLDDFKSINDHLGYAPGDVVLKEVVQKLMLVLRTTDYVARVGGDEFIILLPETDIAAARVVAEKIRQSISTTPLVIRGDVVNVTASIGVSEVSAETKTIDQLLVKTQVALHQSKQAGKNRVVCASDDEVTVNQGENILSSLCEKKSFTVLKQAIMDIKLQKVAGYELLSRFNHPDFKMPDDFFKVCAENNFLTVTDLNCFKNCIDFARRFEGVNRFHMNLFPSTILNVSTEELLSLLYGNNKDKTFYVEISEQQIIGDPTHLKKTIEAFKKQGVQVGIDDVGFGRSSLESLLILEPNFVKIDKKIVTGAAQDEGKARTLERLSGVLHSLNIEIIAEGIESEADLKIVEKNQISLAQGFLFGKPA